MKTQQDTLSSLLNYDLDSFDLERIERQSIINDAMEYSTDILREQFEHAAIKKHGSETDAVFEHIAMNNPDILEQMIFSLITANTPELVLEKQMELKDWFHEQIKITSGNRFPYIYRY